MEKRSNSPNPYEEVRHVVLNSALIIEWHLREIEGCLKKIRPILIKIERATAMTVDEPEAENQPKYDGCSGLMSWTWRTFLGRPPIWESCCDEHDAEYEEGGCKLRRRWSDLKLRSCVAKKSIEWAKIMYRAVRAGGHPLSPFRSRWGFGGKYTVFYSAPVRGEVIWLKTRIKRLNKEWEQLCKKHEKNKRRKDHA